MHCTRLLPRSCTYMHCWGTALCTHVKLAGAEGYMSVKSGWLA